MNDETVTPVEINTELIRTIEDQKLHEADWELLVQMGQEIGNVKTYSQWILGKLGDTVTRKYGALKKYATETRQDYGALRQYMNTYRRFISEDSSFHPNKYYGSVPWGVLALAATKSESPQKLVDELQKENKEVSLKAAYREIKRLESPDGKEPPRKPTIKLQWDRDSRLYRLTMDVKDFPVIDWTAIKRELKIWLDGLV